MPAFATFTIRPQDLNAALRPALSQEGVHRMLNAMGRRLINIAKGTFGPGGVNRAKPWPALSQRYMKRIKYFGPPKLILHRNMIQEFDMRYRTGDTVTVSNESPYAAIHQFGGWHHFEDGVAHIPPRPFFPVLGNQLTPYAQRELVSAAESELQRMLQ